MLRFVLLKVINQVCTKDRGGCHLNFGPGGHFQGHILTVRQVKKLHFLATCFNEV